MTHPIAPYARTAFAQGWAMSGGPMTDRVKAGCVAALDYAAEHADDPEVLEATLRLGHLEGTWAKVYDRRDALLARVASEVQATWKSMIDQLDIGGLIRWFRAGEGLLSESDDAATQRAIDAARVLLHALPETDAYATLRQQLRDGIIAAQVEGQVGALALAADQLGKVGFNYETAFDHIHAALSNLESTWADADTWLTQMVQGAAGDLGRKLAALVRDRAPYDDMLTAADEILGSGDTRAVAYTVDMAVHQSLTVGAMDLWAREGVSQVNFMTAGDNRVCAVCNQAEADNPHVMADAPRPPLHGGCRCTNTAINPIRLDTLTPFLEVV